MNQNISRIVFAFAAISSAITACAQKNIDALLKKIENDPSVTATVTIRRNPATNRIYREYKSFSIPKATYNAQMRSAIETDKDKASDFTRARDAYTIRFISGKQTRDYSVSLKRNGMVVTYWLRNTANDPDSGSAPEAGKELPVIPGCSSMAYNEASLDRAMEQLDESMEQLEYSMQCLETSMQGMPDFSSFSTTSVSDESGSTVYIYENGTLIKTIRNGKEIKPAPGRSATSKSKARSSRKSKSKSSRSKSRSSSGHSI